MPTSFAPQVCWVANLGWQVPESACATLRQPATSGGLAPEEIAAIVYPDLTLAQIYVALAYYEDHRAEIDQATQSEAKRVEQFLRDHPDLVRDVCGTTHQE